MTKSLLMFVPDGAQMPRGYGPAWQCWNRFGTVCLPVPVNVVVAFARSLYLWLKFAFIRTAYDDAVCRGIEIGRQREREAALSHRDAVLENHRGRIGLLEAQLEATQMELGIQLVLHGSTTP